MNNFPKWMQQQMPSILTDTKFKGESKKVEAKTGHNWDFDNQKKQRENYKIIKSLRNGNQNKIVDLME